jgi:phage uncharacterized protein TIGR01671
MTDIQTKRGRQGELMRPIRFRAWDKENKRMWSDVESLAFFRREVNPDKSFCGATITKDTGHPQFYPNEQLELMQFTGLLDKNGKEIYEGDILKDERGHIGQVIWDDTGWAVNWTTSCDGGPQMDDYVCGEVIGNIYSNPELFNP